MTKDRSDLEWVSREIVFITASHNLFFFGSENSGSYVWIGKLWPLTDRRTAKIVRQTHKRPFYGQALRSTYIQASNTLPNGMQITCLFGTINGKNMKISSLDSKCWENSQTLNFCIWLWLGMKYQFGKTNF